MNVSPPIRDGDGDGDSWRSRSVLEVAWLGAKKGAESNSGYDWKKRGPKVVPKNAPVQSSEVSITGYGKRMVAEETTDHQHWHICCLEGCRCLHSSDNTA